MPNKVQFPIVLPYNKTRQLGVNPERTVNMYAVNVGDKDAPSALIRTPGLTRVLEIGSGVVRNLFFYKNYFYAVVDSEVYQIDSNLNKVLLGNIGTTTGQVGISGNNANIIIFVDGTGGWTYYTTTNTFAQITDENFPNPAPNSVVFFNGFFIVNSVGTNSWYVSPPNYNPYSDESSINTWDPTYTQSFQSATDTIVAVNVIKTMIFIFGQYDIEVWTSQPQAYFPFSRDSTLRFQYGAVSVGSVVEGDNLLIWLAQAQTGRSSIMMSTGGLPEPISTTDIDQEINSYSTISDAYSYLYRLNGHLFYSLNFPTANRSWLYDVTTSYWVQQEMQNGDMYIISDTVAYNSKVYAGSRSNPYLYEIDQDVLTNDGEYITRTRITNPFVSPTLQAIRINSLEIDMVQGQGNLNPPGVEPFLELQVSYDRGITWIKQRRARISILGETVGYRCVFRNLGINKDFCFKLKVYDPINVVIRSAAINYDVVGN